jgi:acetoacetyl-CoA synthetase
MLLIVAKFRATYWGTSPRYLVELEQSGILDPLSPNYRPDIDLSSLQLVTTTGATLTTSQFTWFYDSERGLSRDRRIHLSSVAGGTDIASSWIATDPAGPVYANEMQMWALGHACDILDSETAESLVARGVATPGELVCRAPFPSMPSMFWRDAGDKKYREAYFEKFPIRTAEGKEDFLDVWAQHDTITLNPLTQGLQILGRSDGVLNPSGIRFGSSEIYNVVESPAFNAQVSDSLCVGRRRATDQDETVFLFVVMAPGREAEFNADLVSRIRAAISQALSPRHAPKFVERVDEIPYTVNGKKVEVAVKKVISGQAVKVSSTVRNPGCIAEYERFRDLEREESTRRREAKL